MVSPCDPDSPEIEPWSGPTIFDSWMNVLSDCMGVKAPTSRWLVLLVQFVGLSAPRSSSLSVHINHADVQ